MEKNKDDPAWAYRYGKTDTLSDSLRLEGNDKAANIVDVTYVAASCVLVVDGIYNLGKMVISKSSSIKAFITNKKDAFKIFRYNKGIGKQVSYASSEEMTRTGAPIGHIGYPKDIVLHEPPYSVASDLSHVTGKGANARNKAITVIMNEDLKDINLSVTPQYNPFLTSGISQITDEGPISQIGKMQFSNRNDLINTILHEELHNRLKMDGVYGGEYQSVFKHHPSRGVVVEKEKFLEFVEMWRKNPTGETYSGILELAKQTKKWWE